MKLRRNYASKAAVEAAFKQFDTDNDGAISRAEVMEGMRRSGRNFTAEEIDALFILADADNNGQIDFPEFALIMIPTAPERIMKLRRNYASKAAVEAAFKQFDTNHDGAIDFNGDGEVSSQEFVTLLYPGGAPAAPAGGNANALIAKFRGMYRTVDDVRSAFNKYDANKDGNISRGELQAGMAGQFTAAESSLIFDLA